MPSKPERLAISDAVELLRSGIATMILWRPEGKINYKDPESDYALVWRKDKE